MLASIDSISLAVLWFHEPLFQRCAVVLLCCRNDTIYSSMLQFARFVWQWLHMKVSLNVAGISWLHEIVIKNCSWVQNWLSCSSHTEMSISVLQDAQGRQETQSYKAWLQLGQQVWKGEGQGHHWAAFWACAACLPRWIFSPSVSSLCQSVQVAAIVRRRLPIHAKNFAFHDCAFKEAVMPEDLTWFHISSCINVWPCDCFNCLIVAFK